ncbi:MAG: type II toxin-antitoxin system VapC family toxin [Puniceicoccaceae bacterium]|nr:MAG: type II toxin-antitoxin system VapC family toxin [Puniceicoccaceae bacterium]
MKGLLLDTCALIWLVSESKRFSTKQRTALEQASQVYISAISCAEIACLTDRGRIDLSQHWKNWFDQHTTQNGIRIKDIDYPTISEAYSLPGEFHQDPCDRIIVATARILDLSLITNDRKLHTYPFVRTIE